MMRFTFLDILLVIVALILCGAATSVVALGFLRWLGLCLICL